MAYSVNNLSVQEFRGIERLDVPHFERINLFCGPRRCKTAVLQAIYALLMRGDLNLLRGISLNPEMRDLFYLDAGSVAGDGRAWPQMLGRRFKIVANKADEGHPKLSVHCVAAVPRRDRETGYVFWEECGDAFEGDLALKIKTAERGRILPVCEPDDEDSRLYAGDSPAPVVPVVWLNAENDRRLASMWTADFALSDAKNSVRELMWLANTNIEDFMPLGGHDDKPSLYHIRERFPFPMPLDAYGSCVRKLLALGLSLHAAKDGVLLIDDFERDIDSIIMPSVWKGVQLLAREWNVQVFATTRSHECRKAFDRVTEGVRKDFTMEDRVQRRLFVRCAE